MSRHRYDGKRLFPTGFNKRYPFGLAAFEVQGNAVFASPGNPIFALTPGTPVYEIVGDELVATVYNRLDQPVLASYCIRGIEVIPTMHHRFEAPAIPAFELV